MYQLNQTENQRPIICSPNLIREPTKFQSITSTLQSFAPNFSSSFKPTNHFQQQQSTINHQQQQQQQLVQPITNPNRITFSTWIQLNQQTHLLTINPIGITIWDTHDLEALIQLIWIRWDHLPQQQPSSLQFNNLEPISAALLPSSSHHQTVILAILFNSLLDRSSKLIILSTNSPTILHSLDLPGIGLELKTNRKLIAIATKSPLALHLYRWDLLPHSNTTTTTNPSISLSKLGCSPILDLAPKPKSGNPVFNLGQSRLLVYASSKPPSNQRDHLIATGPGVSFAFPAQQHDPRSPSTTDLGRQSSSKESSFAIPPTYSNTRHSSHTGISGSSWKNSVAPNLDAIDETARKLGGGLLTGAKYLSSWGQNLWNPHIDNHHHPILDPAYSQSAPLPHMISAARPTPSSRPEESHGTYGNVKVIDLLSTIDPSQPHRHQPIFHFKSSSDPLTFLSFNPSSTLLLTSSIEGHSFHVFELRPHSRVAISHLRANQHLMPRETTVWHRYKLTRGFTSAEVTDVVWRWDSKIVSVLTEHGTHHLFAIHPAGGTPATNLGEAGRSPRGTVDPLSAIFSPRVLNPRAPPPLSVTVSAFEKIKHKSIRHQVLPQHPDSTGHMSALDYLDYHPSEHENLSYRTSLVFVQPSSASDSSHEQILSDSHKRAPSVLLHDPSTNSVTLYNFESKKKIGAGGVVSSSMSKNSPLLNGNSFENQSLPPSGQGVKKMAATPSGLSQLMQQTKQMEPKLNGQELNNPSGTISVGSFAPAVWYLSSVEHPHTGNRVYQPQLGATTPSSLPSKLPPPTDSSKLGYLIHQTDSGPQNWTSFVELDTFSHSHRILPRSIYLCHQFDFFHFSQSPGSASLPPHHPYHPSSSSSSSHGQQYIEQLSRTDFDQIKKNKLVVKREVQIQPGDLSTDQAEPQDLFRLSTVEINDHFVNHHHSTGPPPGSSGSMDCQEQHQIYAEPLRSAVETVLDSSLTSPKSSSQIFPEFPNGHPGRRGPGGGSPLASLLKKSVTENVVPVVGVVNERVRKELERIAARATIGPVNRRRISFGLNYYNGILSNHQKKIEAQDPAYSFEEATSVSFEEDEAIQIDSELFDRHRPSSSSMTSFNTSLDHHTLNSEDHPCASHSNHVGEQPESWDGWTFEDDVDLMPALCPPPPPTQPSNPLLPLAIPSPSQPSQKRNSDPTLLIKQVEIEAIGTEASRSDSSATSTSTSAASVTDRPSPSSDSIPPPPPPLPCSLPNHHPGLLLEKQDHHPVSPSSLDHHHHHFIRKSVPNPSQDHLTQLSNSNSIHPSTTISTGPAKNSRKSSHSRSRR